MSKIPVNPNAIRALKDLKEEIANELGISQKLVNNKGSLNVGKNVYLGGQLGGNMTKKLIELAEKQMLD